MDVIVGLLCGVALFLFGMLLMGDGLKNVAGNKLEMILFKLTNTPLKGVLLGTGVTAIIQSSSATSIMAVGFVNSGMMKMRQAIGIILGAILGTSVTGWVVCLSGMEGGSDASVWVKLLSSSTLTCLVAVIGIILRMFSKNTTHNHIGDILLGFAILMTGMSMMSDVIQDGTGVSELFQNLAPTFSNPLVGILAGMLVTCVLQSASATVGILQVLSVTGAISFEIALPLIMGIAIGAAVPVLLSALGASVNGRRTAFVYLLIDVLGVIIWAAIFYSANAIFHFQFLSLQMNMVSTALMNTLFRLVTVLSLMPFTKMLEKIVTFIFREKPDDEVDSDEIDRLEERFLTHPAIALEQSKESVCAMARKSRKNLSRAMNLIYNYSEEGYRKVQAKEEVLDRYEDKLGTYLVKLTRRELTLEQSSETSKYLHTIGDFERIGDHAVNIANASKEMNAKKLVFSQNAQKDLAVISSAISKIVILAVDAFIENDTAKAKKIEPLEQVIDDLCDEIKLRHIKRLRDGDCTLDLGFVYNDLLTNLERIADHCSNIAVAIIELKKDEFDTHEYLNRVKAESTDDFRMAFETFRKEFSLD